MYLPTFTNTGFASYENYTVPAQPQHFARYLNDSYLPNLHSTCTGTTLSNSSFLTSTCSTTSGEPRPAFRTMLNLNYYLTNDEGNLGAGDYGLYMRSCQHCDLDDTKRIKCSCDKGSRYDPLDGSGRNFDASVDINKVVYNANGTLACYDHRGTTNLTILNPEDFQSIFWDVNGTYTGPADWDYEQRLDAWEKSGYSGRSLREGRWSEWNVISAEKVFPGRKCIGAERTGFCIAMRQGYVCARNRKNMQVYVEGGWREGTGEVCFWEDVERKGDE